MTPTRKRIELPSGAMVTIRKLCGRDLLRLGEMLQAFPQEAGRAGVSGPKDIERQLKLTDLILTECVSPITMKDGSRVRVVDKDLDRVQPGEITVGELDDADAGAIITACNELNNLTKEAGKAAAPFLPEQAVAGASSPAREALRETPVGADAIAG